MKPIRRSKPARCFILLIGKIRALLADPAEPPADHRAALLNAVPQPADRLGLFFGMAAGHAQVLPMILTNTVSGPEIRDFIPACDEWLRKQPGNPWFHLLRARCEGGSGDGAGRHLEIAANALAGDWPGHPDVIAIASLANIRSAAAMDAIVTGAPGFRDLPPDRRFARLAAGRLDFRVAALLGELSFEEPDHDPIASRIAEYFLANSEQRIVPPGIVQTVVRKLPALCLGSPEKTASAIKSDALNWCRWLGGQTADPAALTAAVRHLSAGANRREIELTDMLTYWLSAEIRNAAGLRAAPAQDNPYREEFVRFQPMWRVLGMFTPPAVPWRSLSGHLPDKFEAAVEWADAHRRLGFWNGLDLAGRIRQGGDEGAAVRFLASVLFCSELASAAGRHRFPRVPDRLPLDRIRLTELADGGWLEPLGKEAEATPADPSNQWIMLLIRMGARPIPETWERLVVPALAAAPAQRRSALRNDLKNGIAGLPAAAGLKTWLAMEAARSGELPADLETLLGIFKALAATNAPDRAEVVPRLWHHAVDLMEKTSYAPQNESFLARVFPSLALCADDPIWTVYLERLRGEKNISGDWLPRDEGDSLRDIDPGRVLAFIGIILDREPPSPQHSSLLRTVFVNLARSDIGSAELARFRPWLQTGAPGTPENDPVIARFLDFASGNSKAAQPALSASRTGDAVQLDWSLASHAGDGVAFPFQRRFGYLDSMFDLTIMAGPHPDRMDVVARQAAAPAVGGLRIGLPADARYAAVLATHRKDRDIIRWSPTTEIRDLSDRVVLPLERGATEAGISPRRLASGGPFGNEDSFVHVVPPRGEIVLAEVPWEEGPAPVVSLWVCGVPPAEARCLSLAYLDAIGSTLGEAVAAVRHEIRSAMPFWHHAAIEPATLPPPATARVALKYRNSDHRYSNTLRVAGALVRTPPPIAPMPGVERLLRIPARITRIAIDPSATRIALVSPDHGVCVFEIAKSAAGGWIPLPNDPQDDRASCTWLAIGGNRVLHCDRGNRNFLIDLAARKVQPLGALWPMIQHHGGTAIRVFSPDGRFMADASAMAGMHLVHFSDDGTPSVRLLETGRIGWIEFDAAASTLTAADFERVWTLALDDWHNAEPQAAAGDARAIGGTPVLDATHGEPKSIPNRRLDLSFDAKEPSRAFRFDPVGRKLSLPPGMAVPGADDTLWFVSSFGSIYRITLSEWTPSR